MATYGRPTTTPGDEDALKSGKCDKFLILLLMFKDFGGKPHPNPGSPKFLGPHTYAHIKFGMVTKLEEHQVL